MSHTEEAASFDSLKARLDEIAEQVSKDDISLDDALSLYEEAVNIGLAACDVSELDVDSAHEDGCED